MMHIIDFQNIISYKFTYINRTRQIYLSLQNKQTIFLNVIQKKMYSMLRQTFRVVKLITVAPWRLISVLVSCLWSNVYSETLRFEDSTPLHGRVPLYTLCEWRATFNITIHSDSKKKDYL